MDGFDIRYTTDDEIMPVTRTSGSSSGDNAPGRRDDLNVPADASSGRGPEADSRIISRRGADADDRIVSRRGAEADDRIVSRRGAEADDRIVSRRGADADDRIVSRRGAETDDRYVSRRGAEADDRYVSRRGAEADDRRELSRDDRSDDGGSGGTENMTNWIVAALAIVITILVGVMIFTGGSGTPGATPTPLYVISTNTPAPGSEGETTPTADPGTEATPTPGVDEPGYRYDAVRLREVGNVCRFVGEADGEAYIRRVVNGSISWADADFNRLVSGSYYSNLGESDSGGYYISYNGDKWYVAVNGLYNLRSEPVNDPNVHYQLKIADCMYYSNLNSRKIFSLYGSCTDSSSQWNLVNIEGQEKGFKITGKNYTESYSSDGLKYTITFNDRGNLLPEGQFIIDDPYFRAVTITAVDGTKKSVEFWSRKPMVYMVAAYGNYKQTTISAYEKPAEGDKVVFIDAGHGGIDWGACYTPEGGTHLVRESTINLNIANRVVELLRADGYKVYTTRDTDIYPGLFETAILANTVKAQAFVSIHQNVDAQNLRQNGTTTYYQRSSDVSEFPENQKGDGDYDRGKALAEAVHTRFVAATGAFNIGVVADNWAVTRETTMPAILIECGFMTNAAELKKLMSSEYNETEAQAIYKGIVDYMTSGN